MWCRVLVGVFVSAALSAPAAADDRGWGYLIDKLIADGLDRGRVVRTFEDPRLGKFTGIKFSASRPHERRSLYRRFLRPRSVVAARRCRARYAAAFEDAQRTQGVTADLLAAILFVETGCGRNAGSHVVLTRLAHLAMANEPQNFERNLARFDDGNGVDPAVEAGLREHARYLERTFYPEVRALFAVADRLGVDPLAIRGSKGGAFGYPQFLPTSYLADGIDADGDGRVRLDMPADAAASCARYLVHHGWRATQSVAQRRTVIWQYNHSDAYVDTILTLAARMRGSAAHHTVIAARKPSPRHRATRKTASSGTMPGLSETSRRRPRVGES